MCVDRSLRRQSPNIEFVLGKRRPLLHKDFVACVKSCFSLSNIFKTEFALSTSRSLEGGMDWPASEIWGRSRSPFLCLVLLISTPPSPEVIDYPNQNGDKATSCFSDYYVTTLNTARAL